MTWKVPRMVKQPGGKTGSAPAGGRIQMPNKAVPLRPISVADAAKEIAAYLKKNCEATAIELEFELGIDSDIVRAAIRRLKKARMVEEQHW